ncbi:hypothetical protein [Proteus phage vB_PmiP_RS51pmB]|nr:hypothetical protein [Proteus phage vB_PmiP_RS51pmB]
MWFKKKKDVVLFISFSAYDRIGREFFGSRMVRLEHDVDLVDFHSGFHSYIASKTNCKPDDVRIISITRL